MTITALLIVALSAFMHAGWNLLVRHGRGESAFMQRMMTMLVVVGFAPALLAEITLAPILPTVGPILLASGFCCGVYLLGLDRGYQATDFTVVYPLVRAMPVLLVALVEIPLGRLPTPLGWLGLLLVVIGCVLAPLTSFRAFHPRAYLNPAVIWIVMAGLGTVGYSMIDNAGAMVIVRHDQAGLITALRYGYWYYLVATVVYLVLARTFTKPASNRPRVGWVRPLIGAILSLVGYSLVLWVYQFTEQVSYVVASRQFSIVVGVIAAFMIFKERGVFVRVTAALLITGGMIVIGVWGG